MAKNYGRSAYRMTARRKAALRKAQLASAKKRRRRRNAAIGAGIVGASAAAAYIGYSHPDKVRNIASDLKRRTPKFSRLRQGKIVETVQPLKKEETIVDSGVNRGWVNGAGPEADNQSPSLATQQLLTLIAREHKMCVNDLRKKMLETNL